MAGADDAARLIGVMRDAIIELVRREGPDLTARQFGVMLTCYTEAEPQTVRGLAAQLDVSKPAITRALDRLAEFHFVKRSLDPLDRRSVLIQRTPTGHAYLRDLRAIMRVAARGSRDQMVAAAPVALRAMR